MAEKDRRREFKAKLLVAAREIMSREGVEALSVRKLARAVNYSTMKLYSEFKGKPEILLFLAEDICQRQLAQLEQIEQGFDRADYLLRYTVAASRFYVEEPWSAEVLRAVRLDGISGELPPSFREADRRYQQALEALELPGVQGEEASARARDVTRALMLGALSLLRRSSSSREKQRVLQIVSDGMRCLIEAWKHLSTDQHGGHHG